MTKELWVHGMEFEDKRVYRASNFFFLTFTSSMAFVLLYCIAGSLSGSLLIHTWILSQTKKH